MMFYVREYCLRIFPIQPLLWLAFLFIVFLDAGKCDAAENISNASRGRKSRIESKPHASDNVPSNKKNKLIQQWDIPMDESEFRRRSNRFSIMKDEPEDSWPTPSISLSIPTGYGAQWGDIYAGFGFTNRTQYTHTPDGYASGGFGLGNASKYIGADLTLTMHDLHLFLKSVFTISFKIHHVFPNGTSIGIGRLNWVDINGSTDHGKSWYGAVSHIFLLKENSYEPFSMLFVHAGLGDGVYRSEQSFQEDKKDIGYFAGVGVLAFRPLTLLANWYHDLYLGASVTPFHHFPLVITAGASDITGTVGDGVRWFINFGWGDSVFSDTFPVGWFRKK